MSDRVWRSMARQSLGMGGVHFTPHIQWGQWTESSLEVSKKAFQVRDHHVSVYPAPWCSPLNLIFSNLCQAPCALSHLSCYAHHWIFSLLPGAFIQSFHCLVTCCSLPCAVLKWFIPVRLFVTPWTVASQAPLSMRILQASVLEWVSMPSPGGSSQPRKWTQGSRITGQADSLLT